MSYNGTVRCGQCHNKGHNKRSCPELKRLAAADPNGYYGRQVAAMKQRSAAPRKCSYCKEPGHTRRTCSTIKKHKLDAKRNTTLVRKGIQKWMNAAGVGPGALITSRRSFYSNSAGYVPSREADEQPRVFLVTEASLTSVMHTDGLPGTRQSHQFIRATDVASGTQVFFGLPHVPTVAPASGFDSYGWETSRQGKEGFSWTLGSAAPAARAAQKGAFGTPLVESLEPWFSAEYKNEATNFDTISPEQAKAIREYLSDSEQLPSEWADPAADNKR